MLGLGALGTQFGRMGAAGTIGEQPPLIVLTGSEIAEDASVGDLVGTLSVISGSGTYAFTITLNDYFEIDGVDDTRVEVKAALSAGILPITIQADNSVDDPIERAFDITVTEVVEPGVAPTMNFSIAANSQLLALLADDPF